MFFVKFGGYIVCMAETNIQSFFFGRKVNHAVQWATGRWGRPPNFWKFHQLLKEIREVLTRRCADFPGFKGISPNLPQPFSFCQKKNLNYIQNWWWKLLLDIGKGQNLVTEKNNPQAQFSSYRPPKLEEFIKIKQNRPFYDL